MRGESGNALSLILIAVALFAALSYAVTQSSRGGGSGVDSEKRSLLAAQLLDYATNIRVVTMRMMLAGTTTATIQYTSGAGPCSSGSNCVFAPEGGGATWIAPDYFGTGASAQLFQIGSWGMGSAAADVIMLINWIPLDLCTEIDDQLGVTSPPLGAVTYDGEHTYCYDAGGGNYVFAHFTAIQ